jgi:hypothetical protein
MRRIVRASCGSWLKDLTCGCIHAEPVVCFRLLQEEEETFLPILGKLKPVDGQVRTGPRPALVNVRQLKLIAEEVKSDMTIAVQSLIDDLEASFADRRTMQAFSILCPDFWCTEDERLVDEEFDDFLDMLAMQIGSDRKAECGSVAALVDAGNLMAQAPFYKSIAQSVAMRLHNSQSCSLSTKRDNFSLMWKKLSGSESSSNQLGEFIKLAKLSLTILGTSVNDERVFSAMSVVKNNTRNRLERHLELAVRLMHQGQFTVQEFPYKEALDAWHAAARRCRYHA